MENFLAFVLILIIAVGGFFFYIDSGTPVNEAPPAVTSPAPAASTDPAPDVTEPAKKDEPLMKAPAEDIVSFPSLDAETAKSIQEMMEKGKTMTAEEKIEMEKKITEMMTKAPTTPAPTSSPAPAPTTAPEASPSPATEAAPAPKPVTREGAFTEIDIIHKGSGKAIAYPETMDGPILRLENFEVTRGPDLYVYLSKNTDIKSSSELGEYISLGALKSSKGNQNYKLPANHAEYKSAVIWCQAFGVLFSSATLK